VTDPAVHLLLVEDDENLRVTLADVLEDEGYSVTAVRTGADALTAVQARAPDVVVLDIMLPDLDGYAICRKLRDGGIGAGVLMLTARTLEDDIVRGFEVGADDYLAKPYRLRELLARVRALARRGTPAAAASGVNRLPGFTIDRDARTVVDEQGRDVDLTRTELDLLLFFLDQAGKALSRELILRRVWGEDIVVDPRTVDNFVSSIKRKLRWTESCKFSIRAVRGVGYRFELSNE
jgi:DNA-binding response OmpR family regulator